eukprot:2317322-Prymnesium_polylepis.1
MPRLQCHPCSATLGMPPWHRSDASPSRVAVPPVRRQQPSRLHRAPQVELRNVVVLVGVCGAGKTAAAYACASELGFKVIEVHPGMARSAKSVLRNFAEATQSHELGKWAAADGAPGAAGGGNGGGKDGGKEDSKGEAPGKGAKRKGGAAAAAKPGPSDKQRAAASLFLGQTAAAAPQKEAAAAAPPAKAAKGGKASAKDGGKAPAKQAAAPAKATPAEGGADSGAGGAEASL